jgi:hypothetical protein
MIDRRFSPIKNIYCGKFLDPCSKLAALENAADFTQPLGNVRSFMFAEIPHGDDPTDDGQTSDDIGVERHL